MLSEMSKTGETEEASFSAADYVLGIIQRAIAAGKDLRITLPGKGEITLFPSSKEYVAIVPDMQDFCQAPASQFSTTAPWPDAYETSQGKTGRITDLLWQAAFHASQGRYLEGCSKYDVVHFLRWPNLSRLPYTPNTMRACALLTRYPTTMMLVPRRLGADKTEIAQIYSAAFCAGLAEVVSRNPQALPAAAEAESPQPTQERSLLRSLFAKVTGM